MHIRRYQPGEEHEIWSVFHGANHNIVSRAYSKEQVLRWAPVEPDWEPWCLKLARTNPFVAVIDAQIVGFAELEPNGHIDYFYCHHRFQRQGIGTALLQAVEAEAQRLNLGSVFAESSLTAIEFFQARGFVIEGETAQVVCGEPVKQFLVRKILL